MSVLEDLQAKVGEEIGVGEWFTMDQDRIDKFADATGDHQWIHVDHEKAAAGPFGTTIAHGFLTLSMVVAIAPRLEVPGVKMGINYGLDRVRFITPVPAGSRIRARSVLREVSEVTGGVQIKQEITIELEGSEKPAAVAETLSRLYA
jgi:acyl dehydratase